jgi:hypothetical protein
MSLNKKELVASLNEEIENLTRLRDWLEGSSGAPAATHAAAVVAAPRGRRGRRPGSRISAAGRKKISEMMKKRWAERRKQAAKGK